GEQAYAWTTSWGVSTRLIGGLIMTHSDDDGLVLPPRIAPAHVVILPITFTGKDPEGVMRYCRELSEQLNAIGYHQGRVEVEIDDRDIRGGEKLWSWIKKGIPIRLEVGERDIEKDAVFMGRRDWSPKDKRGVPRAELLATIVQTLDEIQLRLLENARQLRVSYTREIDSEEAFVRYFTPPPTAEGEPTPIHGGFALTHWSGDAIIEERIREQLGVTVRCIPIGVEYQTRGICPFSGNPSARRVVWAKAY
ncbi:MAG: proline--tRNA ligase, partial [Deltaproteobacteria bacterium]|nr:proline--tRNA ligase [Deltaproteobacteria bacterium]